MKTQYLKKDLKILITKTNLLKNSHYIIKNQLKNPDKNIPNSFNKTKLTRFGILTSDIFINANNNKLKIAMILKKFNSLKTLTDSFARFKKNENATVYVIRIKSFFFRGMGSFHFFLSSDSLVIYKVTSLVNNTTRSNFFVKEIVFVS